MSLCGPRPRVVEPARAVNLGLLASVGRTPTSKERIGVPYVKDRNIQFDLWPIWAHSSEMLVFIAGAGIAGLSGAIAMTKAGHEVTVVERATELREIGAALSIWPNALAALDSLGVGEQVRAVGVEAHTAGIRSTTGATIARFDPGAVRRALGGTPVVVSRAGLQAVLRHECSRLGVGVRLNERLEKVSVGGGSVMVTTTSGEATFAAAIGADGINSTVRRAVVGQDELRDCDRTAWRALIPNPDGLISDAWLTVGVGLQLIASPATDGLAYWAADTPGSDAVISDGIDPKELLRRRFGGWHDPIPKIIEATPSESLIVNRVVDRRPPSRLHYGPILLVGDAAHAMTPDLGQGACQAIEDAALLFACARARPTAAPSTVFEAFEQVRLHRVRKIVADSYRIGRLATTSSRLAAGTRDVLTRLLPESISNRRLATYASTAAFEQQLTRTAA
jgi:2-polyprenyl-6-methoxyphenol hydroxylase-like FAD-dependent oxidoreductase